GQLVVHRREPAGVAATGGRVVSGGHHQVAVRGEPDLPGDVAARAAGGVDPHDLLLRGQVQGWGRGLHEIEPGQLVVPVVGVPGVRVGAAGRRVGQWCGKWWSVVDVDPVVGGEVRVDRAAVEAVLVVVVDRDAGQNGGYPGRRVVQEDLPGARGLDD